MGRMSYVPAGLDVRKVIAALNLLASDKDTGTGGKKYRNARSS
jgi:hypothetical protein